MKTWEELQDLMGDASLRLRTPPPEGLRERKSIRDQVLWAMAEESARREEIKTALLRWLDGEDFPPLSDEARFLLSWRLLFHTEILDDLVGLGLSDSVNA
jgi:hypothetical protein